MPLRFSMGIGSLGDANLILLTGLKETFNPKRERILEILKEIKKIKRQNYRTDAWVKMTDRVFRLLEFSQGFISDRRVVDPKESKRF